jgi:NADH dehydrogenase
MMALDKLPGVAQVAIQGARFAARQITRRLDGQEPEPRFEYFDKGSMATISRFSAVASIGRLRFSGFVAWVLWLAIHLVYIIGFKSRITTLLHWAVSFLGRGRSERAATEQQVFGRLAMDGRADGTLPVIPTDPADAEVSGVAELEDRHRAKA